MCISFQFCLVVVSSRNLILPLANFVTTNFCTRLPLLLQVINSFMEELFQTLTEDGGAGVLKEVLAEADLERLIKNPLGISQSDIRVRIMQTFCKMDIEVPWGVISQAFKRQRFQTTMVK